jgi:transposase, IS30 family
VRACRPKRCKLAADERLRAVVEEKLGADWSPQQITGWLAHAFPDEPTRVSHPTISPTLFAGGPLSAS